MKKILLTIALILTLAATPLTARTATLQEKITGLYITIVNRAADESGLNWWTQRGEDAQNNGKNLSVVLKDLSLRFSRHPTFVSLYLELDNRSFVEAIYRNALGREGNTGGINYWSGELDKGILRSDMLASFVTIALEKDLTKENYPNLTDEEIEVAQQRKIIFRNKIEVALAFTNLLGELSNVADMSDYKTDPAYLASIKIISEVTAERRTVADMVDFLESIRGSKDPIARINHTDTTPPVITLNGQSTITLEQGRNYIEAGATASDDRDGAVAVVMAGSVDTSTVGTYTLVYTAIDSAGNGESKTRTVNIEQKICAQVITHAYNPVTGEERDFATPCDVPDGWLVGNASDTIAPEIVINGQNPASIREGTAYTDAGATATDNRDGTVTVAASGSVDTSIPGTYSITYTATDSVGNSASKSRIVIVFSETNDIPDTLDLSYDYSIFWKQIASDFDARTYSSADYLYASAPDANSCDMGVLSEEAKERVVLVSNHTRELHGLSALTYHYGFDEEVQASALIMKANNMITHHPASNSLCYTQEGYVGSSTSNIYSGRYAVDPARHIIGWIDDARNVSTVSAVGHRRWSLNPFEKYIAYGQNEGFSALKVFGFDEGYNTDIGIDYVAFPYKRYPYLFLSKDSSHPTPWSFSVVEEKDSPWNNRFDYFNNATIKVREKTSGNQLNIANKYYDKAGYGVSNVLTWQVSDWKYDILYEVSIAGVDMQSREVKSFVYEVYIDYKDIITISRINEGGDTIDDNKIRGTLDSRLDEDSFAVYLSGTKTFTGDNSIYSNMAFYINLYDSNKILIKSSDEPFTMYHLGGIYTVVISHKSKETGRYYTSDNTGYTVEIDNPE